jgi:hypothetical protein
MKLYRRNLLPAIFVVGLLSPFAALSQGDLTPPGPPAPSMKTLAQVEPRIPISSLPFAITNPGSYYLTANLTGAVSGIAVQADFVSIDLAGFALMGSGFGSQTGVVVVASVSPRQSLAIYNGTVAGWGGVGIDAGHAIDTQFHHVRVSNNGSHGLIAGFTALVKDCIATGNAGDGIQLTTAGAAIGNNCSANLGAGLHVVGTSNRIEANHAALNSGGGFKVDSSQNLLIKNSAVGNGTDYSIAAGNDYGQILGGLGAGFTNSNPWANFGSVAPSCTDGIKNGTETDVDCGGGTCLPCAAGKMCAVGTDCQSGICQAGKCQPSCTDGIKDGNETDVDCGGATCPKCSNGKGCLVASDCVSGICSGGICQAPSCTDGVKDGTETDVDCGGGTCLPCAAGQMCAVGTDCQSGICQAGKCQPAAASCTDGIKNGNETDVDCGGGTCPKCATGKGCLAGADCVSGICSAGICQAPTCNDGVKNGTETDVDCGGGTCLPCATGKQCLVATDCQSNVCLGGICQ